ncbi:MAG: hypothetical protein GY792_30380 [Gammaproteobacteria bacterium]|nr:hypothetical protein [Gammaproteobacteria bacterium]
MERYSSASKNWLLLLISFALFVLASPAGAQVTKGGATLQGGGAAGSMQPSEPPAPSSYEGTIRELPFGHNIREQCRLRYFIRLTDGYDILLVTKPNQHAPESEEFAQFDYRVIKLEGYYVPERPQGSDLQMMQSPITPSDPRNPCGLAVINVVRVVY